MRLDLTGRTAVVTGASRGIGFEIAQALVPRAPRSPPGRCTAPPSWLRSPTRAG